MRRHVGRATIAAGTILAGAFGLIAGPAAPASATVGTCGTDITGSFAVCLYSNGLGQIYAQATDPGGGSTDGPTHVEVSNGLTSANSASTPGPWSGSPATLTSPLISESGPSQCATLWEKTPTSGYYAMAQMCA